MRRPRRRGGSWPTGFGGGTPRGLGYYDRQGHPIDLETWVRYTGDREYKVIKQETVGPYWVSTVWLGIDHRFAPPGEHLAPVIFETMVFGVEEGAPDVAGLDQLRYCTEDEAVTGHRETVELILATTNTTEGDTHG